MLARNDVTIGHGTFFRSTNRHDRPSQIRAPTLWPQIRLAAETTAIYHPTYESVEGNTAVPGSLRAKKRLRPRNRLRTRIGAQPNALSEFFRAAARSQGPPEWNSAFQTASRPEQNAPLIERVPIC
jgi:hypothetical protein